MAITKNHVEITQIDTSGNQNIIYPKNTVSDVYLKSTSTSTIKDKIHYYGVCTTPKGTAAKTVAISDFMLVTGVAITVRFSNGNSANSVTLEVSGTGAKQVHYGGSQIGSSAIPTTADVDMVYNGSYWCITSMPVNVSGAILVTNGYVIGHSTGSGYNHLPSGGSKDQVLICATNGQGSWSSTFAGTCSGLIASGTVIDGITSGSVNGGKVYNTTTGTALKAECGLALQNQINTLNSNLGTVVYKLIGTFPANTETYMDCVLPKGAIPFAYSGSSANAYLLGFMPLFIDEVVVGFTGTTKIQQDVYVRYLQMSV